MIKILLILFCLSNIISANDIAVSIKPLYSLVQSVLGDTKKAVLIMDKGSSPHAFKIKPSHIRKLNKAKIVFYISDNFETSLLKAINNAIFNIKKISVANYPNIHTFNTRGHLGRHIHNTYDRKDLHIWLDIDNAKSIIKGIVKTLSQIYPSNASVYEKNAKSILSDMDIVEKKISKKLERVKNTPYIVFHDAYQYIDKKYNLAFIDSVTINPNISPSIKSIREIRKNIKKYKIKCIFKEPQFNSNIFNVLKNNKNIKIGNLDLIGVNIQNTKDLYIELMNQISEDMSSCLGNEI